MAATDFDYLATRNEVIEGAFRIVGALEIGQILTADQLDQGVKALQLLVKSWSNKHLFLWSFNQSSFPTVAAQEAYTSGLDASIIGLDRAWVVQSNDDIQLEVIGWGEYEEIVSKETSTGQPRYIAYKPSPGPTPGPGFYLWPSPDAIYTIKVLCITPLQDFDTASASGDVPARFQRALKYGLAEDLFDEYPGPMNERQFVQIKAGELFREAKNSDMASETTDEVAGFFCE